MTLKVAVIGGGSTYTPELIDGLIQRADRLPVTELCLLDPNLQRVGIVGRFAQRMCEAAGSNLSVRWTDDPVDAISDAGFVLNQLRVGGQEARHGDEQMGRDFGLIGQETTGIGGFAKALRTIPVVLELVRVIETHAPTATIINFTNPAGLITELLVRATNQTVLGLCNVPWNQRADLAALLEVPFDRIELDFVGLNHLSWIRGVTVDGEDRTAEALTLAREQLGKQGAHAEPDWDPETIRVLGAIPSYYMMYFYETAAMLRLQEQQPTRAQEVMKIEHTLLRRYEDESLREKPPELMERGGAYYSECAAALMADIWTDAGATHVVSTPNAGALPGLPDAVVVETPARIHRSGPIAVPTHELRADMDALVRTVKDYELLTIRAATLGDADAALLALSTNPLGPRLADAPKVWDRIRTDNAGRLGLLDG